MSCFDVIPRQLWLLDVHKYFQVGAIVLDHEPPNMIPTVVENAVIGRKLIIKDVDPELGLILRHFVIEASLSDGTSYIIDPTARQFRYKGPNGTLVVHRTLDQYVEDFPGVVLSKVGSAAFNILKQLLVILTFSFAVPSDTRNCIASNHRGETSRSE